MREIVLDTETTGFYPEEGDRIVEIGCIELINHIPSGNVYHRYINPERDMPDAAYRVHGLSAEFLRGHKVMAEEIDGFLDFIGNDRLIIHNAQFDMKFLNAELARLKRPLLPMSQSLDTVLLARERLPGAQVNLDALCRRFGIDNSARTKLGALLDAELLAEVYLELIGGRQHGLSLEEIEEEATLIVVRDIRPARTHAVSAEELAAHQAFLEKITDPIWRKYI
ncbi:DNA polymerase III subunit epsilon [Sneathiella sp.]|uniref:DNA polymerase III subunit epsilon n=1 Tax=Sneathiella sp. TaxID=1964365 RepID=UPI002FE226FC